jgi:hypothetical protein
MMGTLPFAASTAVAVVRQRRDLARRPARNQRVRTLRDLPLDELAKCVFGDTPSDKGGHERRDRAEKHELNSRMTSFSVDRLGAFTG